MPILVHVQGKKCPRGGTLYNAILRIARNFLETREEIKSSHDPLFSVLPLNVDIFTMNVDEYRDF